MIGVLRTAASVSLAWAMVAALYVVTVVPAYAQGGTRKIENPLRVDTVAQLVEAILKGFLSIGVPVAIFFIVLAGFRFIAAQGNAEKLSDARSNFVYTIIGVAIFVGAWALAELVAGTLRQIGV